jgi:hypothetical protein
MVTARIVAGSRWIVKTKFLLASMFIAALTVSSTSYAGPHASICETKAHASCCKCHYRHQVGHRPPHKLLHGKRYKMGFHASHQMGKLYDDHRLSWGNDSNAKGYEPPIASYPQSSAPSGYWRAPPPGGSTFNFYGPTTNYFGPVVTYGAPYMPESRSQLPDRDDRMDPWHGYNPNDGLENGY